MGIFARILLTTHLVLALALEGEGRGVPELWDLISGRVVQAPRYEHDEDGVSVRVELQRYASVFIIVNPSAQPETYLRRYDADEVVRGKGGEISLRKYTPGTVQCSVVRHNDDNEQKSLVSPIRPLSTFALRDGWSNSRVESGGVLYKCRFDWPRDTLLTAALVIDGMTQVIKARLNGKDLGLRFAYPFRFDLGGALQTGLERTGTSSCRALFVPVTAGKYQDCSVLRVSRLGNPSTPEVLS